MKTVHPFIHAAPVFRLKGLAILLSGVCFTSSVYGQTYSSFNPGNFGIDGDIYSDTVQSGTFTAAGSHDWFYKIGGTGIGIFDTSGTAYARQQINAGVNYGFTKKMQYPQYATQAGSLLLDGVYTRDYTGNGSLYDLTSFNTAGTNNSAMDPTQWTTPAGGSNSIPGKVDIVDTYIHMRRLSTGSNHVIAYLGASTIATTGNRFFDFEFYKSPIGFDAAQGRFTNSGSAATGGHSAWTFNADGSIKTFGDLTLSFAFSSSAVSSIDIYIWVDYATYASFVPSAFDFTTGSWVGLSNSSGYGYAHVQAKSGGSLQAWGMVNIATVAGPPWAASYSAGQFAEAAIDLTSLGIDPLIAAGTDPCAPPYTRVLVKSRSSSSFSSALQDFIGPIVFLNTSPIAAITPAAALSCTQSSQSLQPAVYGAGTNYTWSTSNGSFTSRTDSSAVGISKGGKYFLSARSSNCNNAMVDSIVVLEDFYAPVATANYTGVLTYNSNSSVTLRGGDTAASNFQTPSGGSQGLYWSWTGPGNFSSTLQNPTATVEGKYTLKVTEKRNGCSAIATVTVTKEIALALKIENFRAAIDAGTDQVRLRWQLAAQTYPGLVVEVERSTDGINFSFLGEGRGSAPDYFFNDAQPPHAIIYYRLRAMADQHYVYSEIIKLNTKDGQPRITAFVTQAGAIWLRYNAIQSELLTIDLLSSNGTHFNNLPSAVDAGDNIIPVSKGYLAPGLYLIRIRSNSGVRVIKVVK